MIDSDALTAALKSQVVVLVDDLRVRAVEVPEVSELVLAEWQAAADAGRTAHDVQTWREGLLAQVAVSWVLGCVFVRFCEDSRLLSEPMLSGTGEWRRWASEAQVEFFRAEPAAGERAYLEHVFSEASTVNGLAEVFGSHNPIWQFGPSDDACRDLIGIWRNTDAGSGELVWDFTDSEWDTRFLGDLYQDLSEYAKKTFALLQTPDFIESFILDRTLDPAIEEFGLDGHDGTGFRMIDPACGSGHFLLGSFTRLADRWLAREPAAGRRSAAARALDSVFGVDLNPFAASIARFRLLVAALRFGEVKTLAEAPNFTIHIAVGDSLLHGPPPGRLQGIFEGAERQVGTAAHLYETEDAELVASFLSQKYHAVVANPPYITPKDPAARDAYRARYATCHGKYSLAVPFMEQLFGLAIRGAEKPAGYVGQITANTFMKREFGKKLIPNYLATEIDLTQVIDTSGTYIPGHGTPTVILLGRNRIPIGEKVRAVLGIRGEPSTPLVPAHGKVWLSIVDLIDQTDVENEYVSTADIARSTLAKHPWSLQGGEAGPLKSCIELDRRPLSSLVSVVGIFGMTNADEVMLAPDLSMSRRAVENRVHLPLVLGELVRDWRISRGDDVVFPYDQSGLIDLVELPSLAKWLWPARTIMGERRTFAKKSYFEEGRPWWEWHQVTLDRLETLMSITFAFVATHNHFVLDRGGRVFKQSAPVIKLPVDAAVDEHLQLLGLLNSSVACFWMKQVFHNKGDSTDSQGARVSGVEAWIDSYELDGTKLKQFPVAVGSVLELTRELDDLAERLIEFQPAAVFEGRLPSLDALAASKDRAAQLRAEMVWLQEELDWRCMYLYGITDTDLSFESSQVFEMAKGERAFEIALACRMESGETESTWFDRHGSTPITEFPVEWPDWYRERVEQRLELSASDRFVNLLERPEYKRRWNWESWDVLAAEALRGWLLTRLEDARYWPSVVPRSVAQLADTAHADPDFVQVAKLYRAAPEVDLVALIGELTKADAVSFLAASRYKESGMRLRKSWERTWDLQRREDAGEDVGKIPVPPKYKSTDFQSQVFWKLRGKLDVPKERFVAYPGVERAADDTAVIGWAGWDHLQQAKALTALYIERSQSEGWETERLVPLLAGLAELVPWLRQWHNEHDLNLGQGIGDYYADYLSAETQRHGLSVDDLAAWRPPKKARARKKKAAKR